MLLGILVIMIKSKCYSVFNKTIPNKTNDNKLFHNSVLCVLHSASEVIFKCLPYKTVCVCVCVCVCVRACVCTFEV